MPFLLLTSCKGTFKSAKIEKSYNNVMKVHDEVMPEISTINRLKKKLRKLEVNGDEKLGLLKDLEDADEGMMSWMAEFKLDKDGSVNDQLGYLKKEQLRIEIVSIKMKQSIQAAQKYLESHQ